jgi:hypothetical protein
VRVFGLIFSGQLQGGSPHPVPQYNSRHTFRAAKMTSSVPKAMRSMRIIALPLTRRSTSYAQLPGSKSSLLTYYHFQINNSGKKLEGGVARWATTKASNIWASFGKAEEGSWKVSSWCSSTLLEPRVRGLFSVLNVLCCPVERLTRSFNDINRPFFLLAQIISIW